MNYISSKIHVNYKFIVKSAQSHRAINRNFIKYDDADLKKEVSFMSLCHGCGNYSGEVGETCPMCGATIGTIDYRNTCPRCGKHMDYGTRVCPRCGQEVRWPGDPGYGGGDTSFWKIGLYIVLLIIILRFIIMFIG